MALPPMARKYVLSAASGTPDVLDALLVSLSADDPRWDAQPDPTRFSLREMVAHLADWEPIWVERLTRIRDEDNPSLPDIDEGQRAIDGDYAHRDPRQSLADFRTGRAAVMELLSALPAEAWERVGHREKVGTFSIETLTIFIVGHDGYHTHQAVQWAAA